jgi:thioredoxin 2
MRVICPSCLSINNVPKKDSYLKANCGKCKESLLNNKPIDLTSANFDEIIVNSDIPVIVDFWASWCGPCKMFAPVFNEVSKKYPLKAVFAKVNTEVEQTISGKYHIMSIPTLIVYKNGVEVKRVSGALDPLRLSNLVNEFI